MRRLGLLLLLAAGCERWSTYAREHHCVEVGRVERTCQMMNVVGWYEVGNVQMPIYMSTPYQCEDITYDCDNGRVVR